MNLKKYFSNFFRIIDLENILYPAMCSNCTSPINKKTIFCKSCKDRLQRLVPINFKLTEKYTLRVMAAAAYKPPIKNLILKKHFEDKVASIELAQLILELTQIKAFKFDYIVPVPLHWTRYSKRGFNQAKVMAKELSKNLKIPVKNILKRKKRTIFQSILTGDKKETNVKDAFSIKYFFLKSSYEKLKDKEILIVDDLCTSGSTLRSAAKTLLDLNPKNVTAIVACRAC